MIGEALILAAGSGLRLKPLTDHAPKCLTEVHGVPILENALRGLSYAGIHTCTLVVGHFASVIEDIMGNSFGDVKLQYVHNIEYRTTNDMYSLWMAAEMLERGVLLLEGDVFFSNSMLNRVLLQVGSRSCYIAGDYNGNRDEILISTDQDMRIRSVDVLTDRNAETGALRFMSAGMLVVQRDYGKQLSTWLSEFVKRGSVEVLFDEVIAEHIGDAPLYVSRIGHHEWVEIDTGRDLERAEETFKNYSRA
jgi:choline kinase